MSMHCQFKADHTFEKRREVSARIREKHPGRLPIIVTRAPNSTVPLLDRSKYLVPADITVGKFLWELRAQMKLRAEDAVFLYTESGVLPPTAALISQIYTRFHDPDGFLYLTYTGENTFGIN